MKRMAVFVDEKESIACDLNCGNKWQYSNIGSNDGGIKQMAVSKKMCGMQP